MALVGGDVREAWLCAVIACHLGRHGPSPSDDEAIPLS